MAQKFEVELNSNGVMALLKSEEMEDGLRNIAEGIARRAGSSGYESNTLSGRKRATGRVFTNNKQALKDNLKNNTLLKVLR